MEKESIDTILKMLKGLNRKVSYIESDQEKIEVLEVMLNVGYSFFLKGKVLNGKEREIR